MSSSSLSMLLLRRERDGQPPRLDVAPADPSFDKQRWSVVDMSQARDEEGHAVVSLVMETPTRGIGYAIRYASSPGGSSHQQDCFTTTVYCFVLSSIGWFNSTFIFTQHITRTSTRTLHMN